MTYYLFTLLQPLAKFAMKIPDSKFEPIQEIEQEIIKLSRKKINVSNENTAMQFNSY